MRAAAPLRVLLLDPHLPEWLPDLRLEGVRVGRSVVDVGAWRNGRGNTRYRIARREGRLITVRQPPAKELV
jgi:hypothetical protein